MALGLNDSESQRVVASPKLLLVMLISDDLRLREIEVDHGGVVMLLIKLIHEGYGNLAIPCIALFGLHLPPTSLIQGSQLSLFFFFTLSCRPLLVLIVLDTRRLLGLVIMPVKLFLDIIFIHNDLNELLPYEVLIFQTF